MAEIAVVPQRIELLDTKDDWDRGLERICRCTRIAYRSDNMGKTDEERRNRNEALIRRMVFRKDGDLSPRHTSTLEHAVFGIVLHCSRAIANEFVRHRHTAFTQESTRYVNFGNKTPSFVMPSYDMTEEQLKDYADSCRTAYESYEKQLADGILPQIARDTLPLGLETTMAMTTNIAEWRKIFDLRCDKGAHPMARQIALTLLDKFNEYAPWGFSDLYERFKDDIKSVPHCEII